MSERQPKGLDMNPAKPKVTFRAIDHEFLRATYLGETEKALELLEKGADIHAGNDLGLRSAIAEGHTDTVDALLQGGADVTAMNGRIFRTAYKWAKPEIQARLDQARANLAENQPKTPPQK